MVAAWVMRRLPLAALVFAGACGAASTRAATISITIDQLAFKPASVDAKVGDTIEWINRDVIDHTSTVKDGGWDVSLPAGQTAQTVLQKAGTFEYVCKFHPNMAGTLIVKEK